jgi:hypothetical protein
MITLMVAVFHVARGGAGRAPHEIRLATDPL